MASGTNDEGAVDDLVDRLRARIAERRASGLYPADVAGDLDAHFARIVAHRPPPIDYEHLRATVETVARAGAVTPEAISYESGVPGGDMVHKVVGKAVSRQTTGVLSQVQQMADAVVAALRELVGVLEYHNAHPHAELVGEIDSLLDRVASLERNSGDGPLGLADVRQRLERLEAEAEERRFKSWYEASEFEERFRGKPEELRDRYLALAAQFDGCDPVVDLGFGRGEFLDLLRERGIECSGVEVDDALVREVRQRGHDVETGDAVAWLASAVDGSLGGISLIQVIEHLTPRRREEVVALAARKLRRGGRLVIETLNPQSLYIFARAFYADPTHVTPVHPAYLLFLVEHAGFSGVTIEWRSDPPPDEVLEPAGGSSDIDRVHDENVRRLNSLLFAPQDYAIIATR